MNYDLLFRKLLQIAIERDCINDYLVGRLGFRVKEDPNSDHTHHAFDYGVLVYNQVNKEKPELSLSQKYVESLEKELSKDDIRDIYIYSVFKCILAQLRFEREGKATFNLSIEDKEKLLSMLKGKIDIMKEKLKQSKYAEGELYENGLYGYLNDANNEYYNKTGNKII